MSAEKFTVHDDMFGAYVKIPTGASRDMHVYKVIGRIESNGYSDVPIMASAKSVRHNEIVPVLNVVHCGVSEDTVIRVALSDCEIIQMHDALLTAKDLIGMDGRPVWWEDKYGHAGCGIVSVTEFGRVIYIVSAIKEVFCAVVDGELNDRIGLKVRRFCEQVPFDNEKLASRLHCKIGDNAVEERADDEEGKAGCLILFSSRRKLADMFEVWAKENSVKESPEGVIAYLTGHGLLDTNKVKQFLTENCKDDE